MRVGWFCTEKRGWVGSKNAFFEFFLREVSTAPPPALPIYPAGAPLHPSAPGTTAHDRQKRRECQMQSNQCNTRHTRPDAGHAAPVCTRYQTDRAGTIGQGAGRWTACALCPKLCRFGHSAAVQKYISFLNTFVARATENLFTVSQKCDIIMSQE